MNITQWIALGGLAATILTLVIKQFEATKLAKLAESRLFMKLKILHILTGDQLSDDEVIRQLKRQNPDLKISEVEVQKTIYEMLADQTIVAYDDGSFSADTIDEEDDDDDE